MRKHSLQRVAQWTTKVFLCRIASGVNCDEQFAGKPNLIYFIVLFCKITSVVRNNISPLGSFSRYCANKNPLFNFSFSLKNTSLTQKND